MRTGFIFDLNKCVGCEACVVACQIENSELQGKPWRSISTFNSFQHPALPLFHFSLACNHCEEPPCLTSCPASAFSTDPIYRTVDHNQDHCIGCGYCTWTCPYDAPKYVTAKGTIEKCTLCKERIVDGQKPNCANLCPTGALDFGEIESKRASDVLGFTDRGIWPGIRFIPLRKEGPPITSTRSLHENENIVFRQTKHRSERKSTLKSEWPLVVFTLLAAFLFAATAASLLTSPLLEPVTYMTLGILGAVLSTFHLGKPLKAWRALLNVRLSWLSREMVAYLLFLCSSGFSFFVSPTVSVGILSVLLGLAALVMIDMVYVKVERRSTSAVNSGSIVVTGFLFFALLAEISPLLIAILSGKCVLYVREVLRSRRRNPARLFASGVRIAVGFVVPLLLLSLEGDVWILIMFVMLGESINRAEFYLDMDIITPRRQIEIDTLKELALSATGRV